MSPEDYIDIRWCVDDVLMRRPDLTVEQARLVLMNVKRSHDACMGVCWDTLDLWAEHLFWPAPQTTNVK